MNGNIDLLGGEMSISEEAKNILKGIPVGILDIPNRAKNALTAEGVGDALNAIEVIRSGFEGMSGIGAKTISDSAKSVDDLLVKIENIEPDLIPNILDPRESYFEHANGNVLQVLSPIMDLYFEKKGKNTRKIQKYKDIHNYLTIQKYKDIHNYLTKPRA